MRVADFLSWSRIGCIYHFTDVANLPFIRLHGLLPLSELESRDIVPPKPGGDEHSRECDARNGLSCYVHCCFKSEHPMQYVACRDGRLGPTRFLAVSSEVLLRDGVMGCAVLVNRSGATVVPLEQALDEMDLAILFDGTMDFGDPQKRERWNEARKAEILVPGLIPTRLIANLG